jgi:hypothetical protein
MIRYLRGFIDLPLLILRADSVPVPKWWVDGSHATHPNICVDMQVVACPLGKACQLTHPPSRSLTLAALPKLNWLLLTTSCQSLYGPIIFSKRKDMATRTPSYTRIFKAQSSLKRTVASQAAREPNISTVVSISLQTVSTIANSLLNIVQPKKWLEISLPNLCKANFSTSFDSSL